MPFNACNAFLELLADGIDARLIHNAPQLFDLLFYLLNRRITHKQVFHVAPTLNNVA